MRRGHAASRALGRYRLLHELGAGATATVHLARLEAPGGFKRLVAVKAVHPRLAGDDRFVRAFLEGARTAARIAHPCIAAVLEMGRDGDVHWVAQEYVHGEPLCDVVAAAARKVQRVPWTVAFRIVADVADALHALHEARGPGGEPLGLTHGALSGSSVFLGYDGTVKVVDVGAPRVAPRAADTAPSLLRKHVPYAAPEQLRGQAVDRRSDVFSAGVLLWELVTGQRLYANASELEVLARAERGEVPSVRSAVPALPERVDAVVRRAVAAEPAARFPTAREMARALTTALLHSGLYAGTDEIAELVQDTFPERRRAREDDIADAEEMTEIFRRDEARAAIPDARIPSPAAEAPLELAPPAPRVALRPPPPVELPALVDDAVDDDPTLVAPPSFLEATLPEAGRLAPATVPAPPPGPAVTLAPSTLAPTAMPSLAAPPLAAFLDPTAGDGRRRNVLVGMLAAGAFLALASLAVLAIPGARQGGELHASTSAATTARAASAQSLEAAPPAPSAAHAAAASEPSAAPAETPTRTAENAIAVAPAPSAPSPAVPAALRAQPPVGPTPSAEAARPRSVPAPPARPAAGSLDEDEDSLAARPLQGKVTVVCYPACDEVQIDREKVGPSPVFKHALAPGRHKVLLRTFDPPIAKALDVVVVAGEEPTIVRQSMTR